MSSCKHALRDCSHTVKLDNVRCSIRSTFKLTVQDDVQWKLNIRDWLLQINLLSNFRRLIMICLNSSPTNTHPHTPPLVPLCKWYYPLVLGLHQDSSLHRAFSSILSINTEITFWARNPGMNSTWTTIIICGIAHCNCPTLIQYHYKLCSRWQNNLYCCDRSIIN